MGHRRRHFIREWRKYRGLTQEQLAERIGIGRSYLSKIESGSRDYDQTFLELAADALRCEIPDLIMRDPTATESIWTIWESLTPVQQQQAVGLLKVVQGAPVEAGEPDQPATPRRTGTGG